MKALYKSIILIAALAMAWACEPGDASKDLGYAKVYIPQATSTGLDNSYPIPSGPFYQYSEYTCKYDKASGKLLVAVGVIRAGYFNHQQAYSVNLGISKAQTDSKVDALNAAGTPAEAFPQNLCTVPAKIDVPEGSSGQTCYVELDLKTLSAQQASLLSGDVYKSLVLGLEISNLTGPSNYELSDKNTSVVIVLDLNSEHWDNVEADKPESEVRKLFPITTIP